MKKLFGNFLPVRTMRKYVQLAKLSLEEHSVYRLNFILWRFRNLILFLSLFFFWLAVYGQRAEFLGYQKAQMLTYVIGIAFLRGIVLSSQTDDLAGQIKSGELTRVVMWPIKMFSFWFSRDLVNKSLNLFFTVLEIGAVLLIFKFPFYFPLNPLTYLYFLIFVLLAIFLYFFLSLFLSATAFWSDEIWATRWLFGIVFLEFLSGAFFPIDIFPAWIVNLINLTPFPYLVFYPLKIWLEQLSFLLIFKGFLICLAWIGIFYGLVSIIWRKGIKNYGAYGG